MAVTHVNSFSAATTSVAISSIVSGDLLVVTGYNGVSNTAVTNAAGWTVIVNEADGGTNSAVWAYKIAAGGETTSGTWTNATNVSVSQFRGASGIGATANGITSASPVTLFGLTLQVTDGTSFVLCSLGQRNGTMSSWTDPTGMTRTTSSGTTAGLGHFVTTGGVTSFASRTTTTGSTVGGKALSVEIKSAAPPTITGTLSSTEGVDTAAFSGNEITTGTLNKSDSVDTAAISGSVTWPTITGTLGSTAPLDTASMTGTVTTPSSGGGTVTSRAWLPTDAASAYSWLKAKSSADYTLSGSTITAIADKTGKSHGASIGARNGIGFSSTGLASQPAFTFSGSSQSLDLAVPANMPDVAYCLIGNFASGYMSILGCENVADLYSVGINGSNNVFIDLFADTNISQAGTVARSTPQIIVVIRNSYTGEYQIRLNGTQVSQGFYNHSLASTGTPNHILGGVYNRDYVTGSIGEVVICDAYDAPTIQKIEGYLAADWGVQSLLPTGHTYKSAAPVITTEGDQLTWTGSRFSWDNTVSFPGDGATMYATDGGSVSNGRTPSVGARALANQELSGKTYHEYFFGKRNGNVVIGVEDPNLTNGDRPYYFANGFAWRSVDGNVLTYSTLTGDGGSTWASGVPFPTTGQTARICIDKTNLLFWVCTNTNSWNGNSSANPATGVGGLPLPPNMAQIPHARWDDGDLDQYLVLRTKASTWTYAAPTGFLAPGGIAAASSGGTLWTPASIDSAKKVGWFDAQDSATITQSGGAVSAWSNKFGATLMSNLTQATSGLQPAYSATGFNTSYAGVTSIAKAMNATITGLTDELTAIIIGKFEGAGGGRFISVGLPGNADWDYGGALLEIINDGGYKFHPYGQYTDFGYVGAQGTSPQSWAAQFKNGASKFRVNGLQPGATNTSGFGFGDPARFCIGDDVQGDRTDCNFTYAEVVLLRGATADDIARVEAYAMWKRGLQGTLDAGHPYKSAAPTISGGGGTTSITGTLAATDAVDTSSITGTVSYPTIIGSLSATDSVDTAAVTGNIKTSGTLAQTDAVDTAAVTGSVKTTGTLASTDPADTSAITGAEITTGALAASDLVDAAAITGTEITTGALSATDLADTASMNDGGALYGSLLATDALDQASIAGGVKTSGTLAAPDVADTAAITGTIGATSGALSATDPSDTASIAGSIKTTGTMAASEAADAMAFIGGVAISGTFNKTETSTDTAAAVGSVYHQAVLAATDAGDAAAFIGRTSITGQLVGVEAKDVCAIIVRVYRPFMEVAESAHETWTAQSQATDVWTEQTQPGDTWKRQ